MTIDTDAAALLQLLQLVSPALPVGAFSYSEGLETLTQSDLLQTPAALEDWLLQELRYGAIRLEAAVVGRVHRAFLEDDLAQLAEWNHWLSAVREGAEIRQQSWQMGRSLVRLLNALYPELQPALTACEQPCNFAVAFGLAAAHCRIPVELSLLGYLQSWATNLITAAVKLVPLGQTEGQVTLLRLQDEFAIAADTILSLSDDRLFTSGWGAALASMQHETLYSRLFRS
ncbi:urease accessory protein UreF [Romeria aff. gracilis LEGE 07310]|uniref:Urease accessory protein UreF n=2 Tax=Vasconcelosia TaxID=3366328 RepID=A0A8J7A7G5_9CYAN|nr:urease accessory protein UreF [Romeria aff. gracilis LEGE 07310]